MQKCEGEAERSSSKGGNDQERSDSGDGVNNAGVGERIRTKAEILGAATPQGGKRHGGQLDPRGSGGGERGETSEGSGAHGRSSMKHCWQIHDTRGTGRGKPGRLASGRKVARMAA